MGRRAIGRVASTIITAGGWLLAGARAVLDLIGYSTVPEDVTVAQTRLDQALTWFLGLPWWLPWGFALISTLWLIWVSWPREQTSTINTALPQQPAPNDYKIDPWVADGTPTFVELHLTVDEFRCKEVSSSNVFDTAVSLLGDDKTKLEILVVFDRWIVSRDAAITCDNRLEDYRTSIQKITDRYLMCQVLNVGSPAVIRIDCN